MSITLSKDKSLFFNCSENPNVAFMGLKAVDSLLTIQFNPHDPSMLISGLMSGQVCSWDIRTSDTPIFLSHPQYSHKLILCLFSDKNSVKNGLGEKRTKKSPG